tara:strand:- start:175 stop:459 length:285 start_codon:yes stop_codon:yes gene_type:complete
MFTVTDNAKKELKRIYESRSLESGMYLRLAIPPVWTGYGDFGIVIDSEQEGDISILFEEEKVLILQSIITSQISNSVLDFKESPDGKRFTLDVF